MLKKLFFVVLLVNWCPCSAKSIESPKIDSFLTAYIAKSELKAKAVIIKMDANVFVSNNSYGNQKIKKVRNILYDHNANHTLYAEVSSFKKEFINDTTKYLIRIPITFKEKKESISFNEGTFDFAIYEMNNKLYFYLNGGLSPVFLGYISAVPDL